MVERDGASLPESDSANNSLDRERCQGEDLAERKERRRETRRAEKKTKTKKKAEERRRRIFGLLQLSFYIS